MVDKIKEWICLTYGVDIEKKHVWMMLVLFISILLLLITLIFSSNNSNNQLTPKPNIPQNNN